MPLGEIAATQKIPANFLTTILSELSRVGIVASRRGRDGGYWLALIRSTLLWRPHPGHARQPGLVPCASRFAHEKCRNCVEEGECRTRALMLQVRDRTADILDSIRLSDRIDPVAPGDELLESET